MFFFASVTSVTSNKLVHCVPQVLLVNLKTVHAECFMPDRLERRELYPSFNVPHKKKKN